MRFISMQALWLAASLSVVSLPVLAEKVSMESGGANSVVGLLPQAMAPHWAEAGVDVELALGQTLTKSLLKIGQGSLDSSVMPPPAYAALGKGKGPYAKLGEEKGAALAANVRSLFGFAASVYHPIVWADSGIESWEGIKGKKVYIGPPAGAANAQITALIKAASGYEEGTDYEGVKAPWATAVQGFRDGQYDMVVTPQSLGSQVLTELSLSKNIRILSMEDGAEPPKGMGMVTAVIPEDTYSGQANNDQAVNAWQTVMMMVVNKDMADDLAYNMTKTYFDSLEKVREGNDLIKGVNADQRFGAVIAPLHPGAVRYYKEQSIEIPAELLAE
ncbi:MAG: TAXI family TRAP transporter solute-binding subunit [Thiolinea sp.]